MAEDIEILKIKLEVLKRGNQKKETSLMQAKSILSAVERGVSWQELGISKNKFQRLCRLRGVDSLLYFEKNETVHEFLELWQAHLRGENVKEKLKDKFQIIKSLLKEEAVSPKELYPFSLPDFFELQATFSGESSH